MTWTKGFILVFTIVLFCWFDRSHKEDDNE